MMSRLAHLSRYCDIPGCHGSATSRGVTQGWTQAHLAQTAGASRQLVVDVERGRQPGTELSRVLAIARALGLGVTLAPLPDDEPSSFDAMLDDIMGTSR
ncbi:helix-turn-helix transcriptional regulator [Cellulomonas sp. NPDC055163]